MNSNRKLIFLREDSFNHNDFVRFDIHYLSKYFDITIINCKQLLSKNSLLDKENNSYSNEYFKYIRLKKISDIPFKYTKDLFVVDFLRNDFRSFFLKRKLKRLGAIFIIYNSGMIPDPHKNSIKKKNYFRLLSNYSTPSKLYNYLLNIFFKQSNLKKFIEPDIVFLGGEKAIKNYTNKKIKFIESHSLDYDLFLKNKNLIPYPKNNYYVFLDENIVFHNDYLLYNIKKPIDASEYYNKLKFFFHKFESFTKSKVIISLHPSSSMSNYQLIFRNFIIEKGNTEKLVQNSKGVMVHASTSLSFGIIYKKPIYFLINPILEKSWIGIYIENMSKTLLRPIINFEKANQKYISESLDRKIDVHLYKKYMDDYIKHPYSNYFTISERLVSLLK